jgi:hypothetical protein
MQVQEKVNPTEEAQKIWDQIDAEETGRAQPAPSDEGLPEDKPADTQAADPAPAPEADAPQDGDDKVPTSEQVLLDRISGLESMLGQVTQRLRNAEGHIGGLGSQLKQQQQVAAQVTAKGGDAPSASEIRDANQNPAKMEALKKDYPEFADAMESALNERLGSLEQQLKAAQQQNQQQPTGVSQEEIQRLRAEMAVEVRHPGWQDRVQTPEFTGWLNRQPREVQMLAASESPQDAVRLLDLHSEATKAVSSQRNQRLSAAAAIPSGRSGSQVRGKAVEDMSPEEYWSYLDQLDKQKA